MYVFVMYFYSIVLVILPFTSGLSHILRIHSSTDYLNYTVGFVIIGLILASVFETLAFVSYFTLLQKRISKEEQGVFNSITMPIIDSSYLIGVIMMGFIINRYSLSIILYIVVSTTILTVFAFIKTFFQIEDPNLKSTKSKG